VGVKATIHLVTGSAVIGKTARLDRRRLAVAKIFR